MTLQTTYKPFCSIQIWHGYELHPSVLDSNQLSAIQQLDRIENSGIILKNYDLRNFLKISPTTATKRTMKNLRLQHRIRAHSIEIIAQSRAAGLTTWQTYIAMNHTYKLSFLIENLTSDFFNYTEAIESLSKDKIFYFSNEADNTREDILYINQTGNYIGTEDIITIIKNQYTYDFSGTGIREVSFQMQNTFADSNRVCRVQEGEITLGTCSISWPDLPAGKYNLTITNLETRAIIESKPVYLHKNEIKNRQPLGVIEIVINLDTVSDFYKVLTNDSRLLSPKYTLWWQNRMTWWRYVLNEEQPPTVTPDTACDVIFETDTRRQLVTKTIQPLTKDVRSICFRQDRVGTAVNEEIKLPNPGVGQIFPEVDGRIFSEVYLGVLNFNI